eukprot:UN07057
MTQKEGMLDTEGSDETTRWLNDNGLSCIVELCLKNDITLEVLMEADSNDIKSMCIDANIKTQHRLKLQSALRKTANSILSPQTSTLSPTEEEVKYINIATRYHYLFKLVLIGDSGVGKSNIMLRFTNDLYDEFFTATVGIDYASKMLQIVWDTAGQERFRSLTASYYKGAHAVLIVYDITNRESFENVSQWLDELRSFAQASVLIFVVGTKIDLETERAGDI